MSNANSSQVAALRIAERALELQILFLGSVASLAALLHPQRPILQWNLALMGSAPDGDAPIVLSDDTGDDVAISMRYVLTKLTQFRGDILRDEMMSGAMLLGAIRLGNMIKEGGFLRPDVPLLEFARHFRNACAHGDRWNFVKGEPRHRAVLRDLELTAGLHGQRATGDVVTARRYVYFLDDIIEYFMEIADPGRDAERPTGNDPA